MTLTALVITGLLALQANTGDLPSLNNPNTQIKHTKNTYAFAKYLPSSMPAIAGEARPATPALTQMPVQGRLTSHFGPRALKRGQRVRLHKGTDFGAPRGTPIKSAGLGRVVHSGWMGAYGRAVAIDHGEGLTTLYAHMDKTLVKRGQKVEPGAPIGLVGNTGRSTGPHLHFEVRLNDVPQAPDEFFKKPEVASRLGGAIVSWFTS